MTVVAPPGRLPDFVLIGTMKSGSTTVFRWLEQHPAVQLPAVKEPNFFSDDQRWQRGVEWYARHFEGVPADVVTGEASVRYTDPRKSAVAAHRLRETVPGARLICVLRNPVDRMRSHFRHEVQRGRERRRFADAVLLPDSNYVLRSCYATALRPWVDLSPQDQLLVVTSERLLSEDAEWMRLLGFLDLDPLPRPTTMHNVTSDKASFSPLMRLLWDTGLVQRLPRGPRIARRLGRRLFLRPPARTADLLDSAQDSVPAPVVERLQRETEQLRAMFPDLDPEWDVRA